MASCKVTGPGAHPKARACHIIRYAHARVAARPQDVHMYLHMCTAPTLNIRRKSESKASGPWSGVQVQMPFW